MVALQLGQEYYRELVKKYDDNRKLFSTLLRKAGFQCYIPEGAYYIMTDISNFGFSDDTEFAHWLVKEIGVGGVPGSSFYSRPELGRTKLRFMFSKDQAVLREAADQLMRIGEKI